MTTFWEVLTMRFGTRRITTLSCAVSVAVLLTASGVSQATDIQPPSEEVDLYLVRGGTELVPGGSVDRAMTVINHGRDMVGEVEMFYTTPIYINIDDDKPLQPGCAIYYKNKDFRVPEVVKCTLSPLKHGERVEVTIPLKIHNEAPAAPTYGTAIVRPARPAQDVERNITDNIAIPGGVVALPVLSPARDTSDETTTGPYLVVQTTSSVVSGKSSESVYQVQNIGDQAAQNIRLEIVTPLYVNTSTAGPLPAGCHMILKDPDPAVPEIVDCEIGELIVGQSKDLRIPIKAVPKGPAGQMQGVLLVTGETLPDVGSPVAKHPPASHSHRNPPKYQWQPIEVFQKNGEPPKKQIG